MLQMSTAAVHYEGAFIQEPHNQSYFPTLLASICYERNKIKINPVLVLRLSINYTNVVEDTLSPSYIYKYILLSSSTSITTNCLQLKMWQYWTVQK